MYVIYIIKLLILVSNIQTILSTDSMKLSDKRSCANKECSVPISEAKSLVHFASPTQGILSFRAGREFMIYSKGAGENMNLWGAEIDGKRGYVPKNLVQEEKMLFTGPLSFLVNVERVRNEIKPDPVKEAYEVLDGTTVYIGSSNEVPGVVNTEVLPLVNSRGEGVDIKSDAIELQPNLGDSIKSSVVQNAGTSQAVIEGDKDSIGTAKRTDNEIFFEISNKTLNVDDAIKEKNAVDTKNMKYAEIKDEVDVSQTTTNVDYFLNIPNNGDNAQRSKNEKNSIAKASNLQNSQKVDLQPEVRVNETLNATCREKAENPERSSTENAFIETPDSVEYSMGNGSFYQKEKNNEKDVEDTVKVDDFSVEDEFNDTKFTENNKNDLSKQLPETNKNDLSKELPKNNKNDLSKQLPETNKNDLSKELPETNKNYLSKELAGNNKNDLSKELHKNKKRDNISPEIPQNNINDLSKQLPETNKNDLSKELAGNNKNDLSKELHKNKKQDNISPEIPENNKKDPSKDLPENNKEGNISPELPENNKNYLSKELAGNNKNDLSKELHKNKKRDNISPEIPQNNINDLSKELPETNKNDLSKELAGNNKNDLSKELHKNKKQDNISPEIPENNKKDPSKDLPENNKEGNISPELPENNKNYLSKELPETNKNDLLKELPETNKNDLSKELHENNKEENVSPEIPENNEEDNHSTQSDLAEENVDNEQEIRDLTNDNTNDEISLIKETKREENEEGFFSNIFSNLFGNINGNLSNMEESFQNDKQNIVKNNYNEQKSSLYDETGQDYLLSNIDHPSCSSSDDVNCPFNADSLKHTENFPFVEEIVNSLNEFDLANFFDIILVLSMTGGFTVIFFLGYVLIDKSRREGPLIAKINNLEKSLFVSQKENVLLAEKSSELDNQHLIDAKSIEEMAKLRCELEQSLTVQSNLQEQIQSLEKELENSTEVGLELNKMISDMLSAQNGSDVLTTHVEQLQNQLVDQHGDIAKYKERLNEKTTENHELQLEFDINKKKLHDLQTEIDNMLLNVLKVEEERDENQQKYENTLAELTQKSQQDNVSLNTEIQLLNSDLRKADKLSADTSRNFEMKSKEFDLLRDSMKEVKAMRNNSDTLKSLLDISSVKAELHQLKMENLALNNKLKVEQEKVYTFEKQAEIAIRETQQIKVRFDETDRERAEAQTKLDVLGNYFREKEGQLQKELTKHEVMWNEKQGEASSTVERIKFMQEELQNYKSQNETLKHEIMSQEVDFKSQISVLEKKSHEYWLNGRQVERKLDDARQEAAQLRNRLTLQERTYLSDDKTNGIMDQQLHMQPLSPLHHMGGLGTDSGEGGLIVGGDSTASPPPMLYTSGHRDRRTSSPHNLHNMPPPPPFLPPFMPPPPMTMSGPPPPMFMHPLPPMVPPPLTQGTGGGMFGPPGDHRPPPLGRISSPPLPDRARHRSGACYSPSSSTVRTYSPYDERHTPPSPSYDDDDDDLDDIYNRRGAHRRYYTNSYNVRHLDVSPPHILRSGGTTKNDGKGSTMSSGGSANSTASAEKGTSSAAASGQYHHNTNV